MAKLPDFQALGERPSAHPAGGVATFQPQRDTLDQSIALAGHDLERASAIVEETNRRQDTIAAEAALNKLQEHRVTLEFDEKQGFRSVKEGGAVGQQFIDANMGRFNDTAAAIEGNLQNEQQRALFKQRMPVVGLQFRSSLLQHQSAQTEAFNDATEKGTIDAELRNIAQHPDNDLTFKTGLLRLQETIKQSGARKGLPAEAIAQIVAQHDDAAHSARILSMIEGMPGVMAPDPYRAAQLLKDAQDKLGPQARLQLSAHVAAAVGKANDTTALLAIQKDAPGVFSLTSQALGLGAPPPAAVDPNVPRGIRNNNPGNLRLQPADARGGSWIGQVQGADAEYAAFESPQAGVRAMTKNLLAYQDQHGLHTVQGIVGRWAPPTENNTGGYVANVAKALGVKPDQQLNLRDPAVMSGLVSAMIQQENGKNPYAAEVLRDGVMAGLGLGQLNPRPEPAFTGPAAPATEMFSGQRAKTGIDFIDNAPTGQLLHWRQEAHTEMQRGQATARAGLKERVQDLQARALSGVNSPIDQQPTQAEYVAAYGQEGIRRHQQEVVDYVRLGGAVQVLQTASAGERAEVLRRWEPVSTSAGFEHGQRMYTSLVQASQIIEKQLAADPAAYALTYAPKVSAAQANMQQVLTDKSATDVDRRAAVSGYATATLAEQQRLGVQSIREDKLGEGGKKRQLMPRLLTNSQANAVAAQFATAPANAAQLMDGLQAQWGSYFPQVFGQLAQDGKLPPAAMVIPNMSDAFAKETLARLSEPDAKKGLDEKMGPSDKKDISDKLLSLNEGFYNSLAYQDGGQKTYNDVIDQQRLLAMGYRAQGMSVSAAAARAHDETVGHAYQFSDTMRIPKAQQPDLVLGGTRVVLNQAGMLDMQVPPSFRVGLKDEDRRAAWVDAIRAGGTFVSNGDESGATLFVRAKNDGDAPALFAARSSDGTPLTWSWSQLRGLYNDRPGAAASDAALQAALAKGDRATAERIQRDRAAQRLAERGGR